MCIFALQKQEQNNEEAIALLLSSCAHEFNQVYKSDNVQYKYEYAKECFAKGKYVRAITLLQELVTLQKGTENAQESLYMLAMAQYNSKDYETAAQYFKKYYQSYPKGRYAEMAQFYVGQSLFMSTPEPRLDQSRTIQAIQLRGLYHHFAKRFEGLPL